MEVAVLGVAALAHRYWLEGGLKRVGVSGLVPLVATGIVLVAQWIYLHTVSACGYSGSGSVAATPLTLFYSVFVVAEYAFEVAARKNYGNWAIDVQVGALGATLVGYLYLWEWSMFAITAVAIVAKVFDYYYHRSSSPKSYAV